MRTPTPSTREVGRASHRTAAPPAKIASNCLDGEDSTRTDRSAALHCAEQESFAANNSALQRDNLTLQRSEMTVQRTRIPCSAERTHRIEAGCDAAMWTHFAASKGTFASSKTSILQCWLTLR